MQIFKENISRSRMLLMKAIPETLEYRLAKPALLSFEDGNKCSAGCLGCNNPKCMVFEEEYIECAPVPGFPNDRNDEVCPVSALSWDLTNDVPVVDKRKCINCGLCISRCPVGAMYYDGGIKVANEASDQQIKAAVNADSVRKQKTQIQAMSAIQKTGAFIKENDDIIEAIYKKLDCINHNCHNTIARNLLIGLGCSCAMRRIGDVYTRMDAVYSTSGTFGAVEVEFGRDTLDASRGILDDIAVLNTRYGIKKEKNDALVVCLQLPNARQGYWQVVRDIRIVEGLKINTVTIGALMILLWNNQSFDPKQVPYYIDYDNMNLRAIVKKHIGNTIMLSDKILGILEPMK